MSAFGGMATRPRPAAGPQAYRPAPRPGIGHVASYWPGRVLGGGAGGGLSAPGAGIGQRPGGGYASSLLGPARGRIAVGAQAGQDAVGGASTVNSRARSTIGGAAAAGQAAVQQAGPAQRPWDWSSTNQYGPNAGMPLPSGGPSQGHGSFGLQDFSRPAQETQLGSVNWNNFAAIQNYMGNLSPDQQGQASQYLRSQGLMPSYNGQPLDQAMANGPTRYQSWTENYQGGLGGRAGPFGGHSAGPGGTQFDANAPLRINGVPQSPRPMAPMPGAAGGPGGMGGPGGAMGEPGGMGGGSGLDGAIEQGYMSLLNGGLNQDAQRRMVERQVDTVARGSRDGVEQARLAAARRGRTLGPEAEARIRAQGASLQADTRDRAEVGQRQEALNRILQSLGGASNFNSDRQRQQVLLAQLAAQGAMPAFLNL